MLIFNLAGVAHPNFPGSSRFRAHIPPTSPPRPMFSPRSEPRSFVAPLTAPLRLCAVRSRFVPAEAARGRMPGLRFTQRPGCHPA